MALMQTLVDPFNGTTLNGTLWTQFTAGSAVMSYQSTDARTTFPASSTSSTDGDINSKLGYSLVSSYAILHVIATTSGANNDCDFALWASNSNSNSIQWQIENGTLFAQYVVAGAQTNAFSVAFSLTTHAWLRIRESGGTTFWDTSSDGITWVNRFNVANKIVMTNLFVDIGAISFGVDANAGSYKWNNFNNPPVNIFPDMWAGQKPDRIPVNPSRRHQLYFTDPTIFPTLPAIETITMDKWQGSVPDKLFRLKQQQYAMPSFMSVDAGINQVVGPDILAATVYRNFDIVRPKDRRHTPPTYFTWFPDVVASMGWPGSAPDIIFRLKDRRDAYPTLVQWQPDPLFNLAWRPSAPDILFRLKDRRSLYPPFTQDTFPIPNPENITLDKFMGYQPSYIYRLKDPRYRMPSEFRRFFEVPPPPVFLDKFQPIRPDQIWRTKPRTFAFPYLFRFEGIVYMYTDPQTLWGAVDVNQSQWALNDVVGTPWTDNTIPTNGVWTQNDTQPTDGTPNDVQGTQWDDEWYNK